MSTRERILPELGSLWIGDAAYFAVGANNHPVIGVVIDYSSIDFVVPWIRVVYCISGARSGEGRLCSASWSLNAFSGPAGPTGRVWSRP